MRTKTVGNRYLVYCENCGMVVSSIQRYSPKYSCYFYECPSCHRRVWSHPNSEVPMGFIPSDETRELRIRCHELFDHLWRNTERRANKRTECYKELATYLGIKLEDCHFGKMENAMLKEALKWLEEKFEY